MSKFSKILIPVFLALSVSVGFTIFHFSNAQNGEDDVSNNQEFINFEDSDSFPDGTVYICPEASSLEEINPRCPGKKILKLGETIDGLTLTTTNYESQDYYMVLGFVNGGGAVNLPPSANARGPYEGYSGLPVIFDASSSTDPNNDSLQYRWDFNNDEVWDTDWLNTPIIERIWDIGYEGLINLEVSDGEFIAAATTSAKIIYWNYIFTDNFGRNTTLKINTEQKRFQFIAPTFDTGVIKAPDMKVIGLDGSIFKYQTRSKVWTINPYNSNVPSEVKGLASLYPFKELPKKIILISHRDKDIIFNAIAIDSKTDFCVALLYRKATKKTYLLIDKPGIE